MATKSRKDDAGKAGVHGSQREPAGEAAEAEEGPVDEGGDEGLDYGHMRDEAQHLMGDARAVLGEIAERLDIEGRIERSPIGTVLAAAGIGFVLGGGIFRPLAGRVIGAGLRLALIPLIRDQVMSLAEPYVSGLVDDARETGLAGGRRGGARRGARRADRDARGVKDVKEKKEAGEGSPEQA
jgi:hypothetical protein